MANLLCKALILLIIFGSARTIAGDLDALQAKVRSAGEDMLDNLEVSYVYGGSKVGDEKTCAQCNSCLEDKRPAPKLRLKLCPTCLHCSLDCSHFVQLVFSRAGLGFPYLTSSQMLRLSSPDLVKTYGLMPVALRVESIIAGDLLVYDGHVVIVEKIREAGVADIIHATGGKDIREPGQGIQRERFVRVAHFRGELLRVLRHVKVNSALSAKGDEAPQRTTTRHSKLRPVEKRSHQ